MDETILFAYVKLALDAYDFHGGVSKTTIKYSRFEHTKRVYRWAMLLAEPFAGEIDLEALKIATIFHDIGYSMKMDGRDNHAADGAVLCREYLFDDTGAHGIVMDAWIEGKKEDASFEGILEHIKRFSQRQMQENPMRTETARRIREEKKALTNQFVESLEIDLYGVSKKE